MTRVPRSSGYSAAGVLRLWLLALLILGPLALSGRSGDAQGLTPEGHLRNRQLAAEAHETNLRRYTNNPAMLVLPGLVADRNSKRVEVCVERTRLGPESPCEFTVIAETSDHGYESLLIAFAKPSDVHRAIEFIGLKPGVPWNPGANRFWARGERLILSLVGADGRRFRLEQLLLDRRIGRTLREEGFVFTGSLTLPAAQGSQARVYVADESQPMSIVSLYNSPHSVLQVPYTAPQGEVYESTIVNPEHRLPEGVLLSLILESASPDGAPRIKDLVLRVRAGVVVPGEALTGVARLNLLNLELKDGAKVLNAAPSLLTVLESLARLDRKQQDCYLTVMLADDVELGDAQQLARVLSTIDSDRGVRIEPPPAGELYYRAFTPDPGLLDRKARIYHPWELSLVERNGQVAGTLHRIESVWKEGSTVSQLQATEVTVSGPEEFQQALDREAETTRRAGLRARPPVIMVFAAPTLRYGALRKFLALALPTHPAVHVYLGGRPGDSP